VTKTHTVTGKVNYNIRHPIESYKANKEAGKYYP
jgi:hypothetical protein